MRERETIDNRMVDVPRKVLLFLAIICLTKKPQVGMDILLMVVVKL